MCGCKTQNIPYIVNAGSSHPRCEKQNEVNFLCSMNPFLIPMWLSASGTSILLFDSWLILCSFSNSALARPVSLTKARTLLYKESVELKLCRLWVQCTFGLTCGKGSEKSQTNAKCFKILRFIHTFCVIFARLVIKSDILQLS